MVVVPYRPCYIKNCDNYHNDFHLPFFDAGNIIAVYSETGRKLGTYAYDAWGQFQTTLVSGTTSQERRVVSTLNPFRYRGYYYDVDTGLYYLQSRYYDPLMGRFISADGYLSTGTGLMGYNMYAYCNNNPVMFMDVAGEFPWIIAAIAVVAVVTTAILAGCSNTAPAVSENARIYDVPLYNQGNTEYCGLYCQVMAEAYATGTNYSNDEVSQRVQQLYDTVANGEVINGGVAPHNQGAPVKINNIMDVYNLLENGPAYATYESTYGRHMVLVTGVDYQTGLVYTNNPWGKSGYQTFSEFQNGVVCEWPLNQVSWDLLYMCPIKED